jgi:peptide/nickel transport system substrate-binding protein
MESLVANATLTLVKNPDYWAKGDQNLPYLDKVVINYIGDEMARFGSLMSNQSDMIYTPPHTARPTIEQSTDYAIYPGMTQYEGIILNTKKVPAFANPLVREAINIAINRKEIVDVALDGVGTAMLGDLELPGTWAANGTEFVPPEGSIEKAKELMKQAGYEKGFSFTLSNWELWPTEVKAETLIQATLAQLNIDVKFEHVNGGQWADKVMKGNIDAVFQGWGSLVDPDFDYRMVFHPTQAYVLNVWDNQKIADMIDAAAKEMDTTKRGQAYKDIITALYASGQDTYTNVLLLWREPQDIAMNVKRVHGYVDDGSFGNLTALKQMWVSK